MKPEFWVFSVFSLVSLSSYFYFCYNDKARPELRVAIYFLISGLSMAGAYNIVCFAFSPSPKDPNESLIENDLLLGVALLAGALSLAWYSIEAVVSEIFASRKK